MTIDRLLEPSPSSYSEFSGHKLFLSVWGETWLLAEPFKISRAVKVETPMIVVEVRRGGFKGRGEASGVDYAGESQASMIEQVLAIAPVLEEQPTREYLQKLLPPGGARNALDCALWDLECKTRGLRIWHLTGPSVPGPIQTYFTLGMKAPEKMAEAARHAGEGARLKIKVDESLEPDSLVAIRDANPTAELIVDANEGWTIEHLADYMPLLLKVGVRLIEQPLPAAADNDLIDFQAAIPLCADESCSDRTSLAACEGKYEFVNIKLDKSGGLTEALALADAAEERGLRLMVGCMEPTSLGVAPGWVLAQRCEFVDLDGHLLNKHDRPHGFGQTTLLRQFDSALWG